MFGMKIKPDAAVDPDILVLEGVYHSAVLNLRTGQNVVFRDDASKMGAIVDPVNIGTMLTMPVDKKKIA